MQILNTGWIEPENLSISGERRIKPRYKLHLPLSYNVLDSVFVRQGFGWTRNLSSGGIAFETPEDLPSGARLELAIEWPVALGGSTPLKLVVQGHVVWSGRGLVALYFKRCQFRTRRRAAASAGLRLV